MPSRLRPARPGAAVLAATFAVACSCERSAPSSAEEPEARSNPGGSAGAPDPAPAAVEPPEDEPRACELVEDGSGPPGEMEVSAEVVVAGLEVPWAIGFLPGGGWLVTERPGRIRLVEDGTLVPEPVARIDAVSRAEGGLLGLTVHPDFARNRLFYIYYTAREGGRTENRVERWRLSPDRRSASKDRVIFAGIPAARFHDGGRIRVGPDRMLYIATGDATRPELAQKVESPAGKILRLTLDGDIPADNPWPGEAAYVIGVRNTEAFDWATPELLYVADHGPSGEMGRSGHDEVSVAKKRDNLGWPTIYGCQSREGMVTPVLSWVDAVPPGGAAVYTGDEFPAWGGDFIIGSLGARHLHRVEFSADDPREMTAHDVFLRREHGRLREVAMGPGGELYVTTSNCDGRGDCPPDGDKILRIRP